MARRSLNKVFLMGNLTRDPVVKYAPSGAMICLFGLATNRTVKKPDGTTEEVADFINISATGKLAEICYKLLAKGMLVLVEGELRTRTWESPAGEKQYRTEVRISDMMLLDSKGKKGVGASAGGVEQPEGAPTVQKEGETLSAEQIDEILEEEPELPPVPEEGQGESSEDATEGGEQGGEGNETDKEESK